MNRVGYIKLGLALFFMFAGLDLLGILLENMTLRYIFKPLINSTLVLVYLASVKKPNKWYIIGLIFAFIADILLLNSANLFFLLALISFLFMYFSYITIVIKRIENYSGRDMFLAPLPFVLVLILVIFFVYANSREFFIPILIYGILACVFGSLTFYNYLEKRSIQSLLLFFGSFFLITSNVMSAMEKFYLQNRELAVGIMLTYVCAQFLIYKYMTYRPSNSK